MPTCLSTCWNSSRHSDGEEMVREILDLGFDAVELSHGMKISLLPGIKKMHAAGQLQISGLHNFCPSPVEVSIDAPDCYEFTSHKPYVRDRAMKLTLQTIDFAAEIGGKYVVLHMGSVPLPAYTDKLERLASAGRLNSRAFVAEKLAFIRQREKTGGFFRQRARDALARLADHAAARGIVLGVESRSHYEQVPSEREMLSLMVEFKDHPGVGYWHDFGHVQRKHNLSLLDHAQWLEHIRPHIIGCHVHDVEWPARDHRVPFLGDMGLEKLLPLVPPGIPMVWELSSGQRRSQIRQAKEVWDRMVLSPALHP